MTSLSQKLNLALNIVFRWKQAKEEQRHRLEMAQKYI